MVALLNGAQGVPEWGACTVDDEEEFVLPGLADDRLRLQAADIDVCRGEDVQYLEQCTRLVIGRDDERGAVGTGWCVAWCEDDEAGDVVVAVLNGTAQDGQVMESSSSLASDGGFVRVTSCFDIGDRSRCVEKFILRRMRQLGGKKALALRKCDGVRIYLGNIS